MTPDHHRTLRIVGACVATIAVPALLRTVGVLPPPVVHASVLAACLVAARARGRAGGTPRGWLRDTALTLGAACLLSVAWRGQQHGTATDRELLAPFAAVLLGAVAEEVVYRGWLPSRIAGATRSRVAPALLSSLAFALAHPVAGAPASWPGHALAGGSFFALRGRDGSLVAPMLAHSAYNALVRFAGW